MEVYRRSSGLLLLLGLLFIATTLQGVQGEIEAEGPSESECRPFVEKALKELETGEVSVGSSAELGDSKEDVPTVEVTDDSDHQEGEGEKNDVNEDGQDSKENEIVSEKKIEKEVRQTFIQKLSSFFQKIFQKTPSKKEEAANESESYKDKPDDSSPKQGDQPSIDDKESKEAETENGSHEDSKEIDQKGDDSNEDELKEDILEKDDTPSQEVDKDKDSGESNNESIEDVNKDYSKEELTINDEQIKDEIIDEQYGNDNDDKSSQENENEQQVEHADKPQYDENEKSNEQKENVDEVESIEAQNLASNQDRHDDSSEQVAHVQVDKESFEEHLQSNEVISESSEEAQEGTKDDSKEDTKDNSKEGVLNESQENTEEDTKNDSNENDNIHKFKEATKDDTKNFKEDTADSTENNVEDKSQEKLESQEDVEASKDFIIESTEQEDNDKNDKEEEKLNLRGNKDDERRSKDGRSTEEITDSKNKLFDNIDHKEKDTSSEDGGPVEELSFDTEIPTDLKPRDHVEQLLKLDFESSEIETVIDRVSEITLRDLKKLYENAIKPLETVYKYRDLSNRHFADSEIFSKPLILFMGPWSGGKSTIINYLTNNEYNDTSLRTGAEPSPAYFNILMYGEEPEIIDGAELAADFTFSGLQKFGQGLEQHLRGVKLPSKLLKKVNIVEIPGILEVRKQVSRVFPFNDACQWFIDRGDIIFLVYDPSKLDVGPETEAILDQLKGREHQTRIILNKADQVKPEELMRVQGALIWNISPLMSSPQPPLMYTTSLWSRSYEPWAPVRLLQAQERAFLRDLRGAIDKRIENKIASARRFAVRVRNHAKMVDCYLTTYYNHKSMFGNRKQVADAITEHPQDYHIYEGLSTLTNISRYDLPDPDVYRDFFKLNPLYEFQQLSATCTYFRGCPINRLDIAIAYDLPELLGMHKKRVESALAEAPADSQQTSAPGS